MLSLQDFTRVRYQSAHKCKECDIQGVIHPQLGKHVLYRKRNSWFVLCDSCLKSRVHDWPEE